MSIVDRDGCRGHQALAVGGGYKAETEIFCSSWEEEFSSDILRHTEGMWCMKSICLKKKNVVYTFKYWLTWIWQ
jgi:hypothetical protein